MATQDPDRRHVTEEQRQDGATVADPAAGGSENRYTGEGDAPSYEAEVEAEHEGTTADEVEREDDEPDGEAARIFTG